MIAATAPSTLGLRVRITTGVAALTERTCRSTSSGSIAALDWLILVAYFIAITGIGLLVGYHVRRSGEYFLGGRRFGFHGRRSRHDSFDQGE